MITAVLFLLAASPAVMANTGTLSFIRSQTALVAEMSLSTHMNDCLLRSYCLVGANNPKSGSIAKGIEESYQVLSTVLDTVHQAEDLVNMNKLKTAYELGISKQDPTICHELFNCKLEENFDLTAAAVGSTRTTKLELPKCENIGAVCPGASISCALCGIFLPSTCSTICPVAGIFCGASGYLCMLQK